MKSCFRYLLLALTLFLNVLSAGATDDYVLSDFPYCKGPFAGYVDFSRTKSDTCYDNYTDRYSGRYVSNEHLPEGMTYIPTVDNYRDVYCPYPLVYVDNTSTFDRKFWREWNAFKNGKRNTKTLSGGLYDTTFLNYYETYTSRQVSNMTYLTALERYLVTDNIQSVYPDGTGIPFSADASNHAYIVSSFYNDTYFQRLSTGLRIPYERYRNQNLKLHFRVLFFSTKAEEDYMSSGLQLKIEAYSQYALYKGTQQRITITPDGYASFPYVTPVYNQGTSNVGDVLLQVKGLVVDKKPNLDAGINVDLDLSFFSIDGDDASAYPYVDMLLEANADKAQYFRIAVDSITVDMEPRFIYSTNDCVSAGDDVTVGVHNYAVGSMFLWDYYSDTDNEWKSLSADTFFVKTDEKDAQLSLKVPADVKDTFKVRATHLFARKGDVYDKYKRFQYLTFCRKNSECDAISSPDPSVVCPTGRLSLAKQNPQLKDVVSLLGAPVLSDATLKKTAYQYCEGEPDAQTKWLDYNANVDLSECQTYSVRSLLYYTDADYLTCSQSVDVQDVTNPICGTLPDTLTLDTCFLSVGAVMDSVSLLRSWSDNCTDADALLLKAIDGQQDYKLGETRSFSFTVTDGQGNSAVCSQLVHLDNHTTCPQLDTLHLDLGKSCSLPLSAIKDSLSLHVPVQNTGCESQKGTLDVTNLADVYTAGVYKLNWNFQFGKQTSCTQYLDVRATQPPIPDCKDTLKISLTNAECVAASSLLTIPSATDYCGNIIRGTLQNAQSEYAIGQSNLTWTFVDKAGLSSVCSEVLIVEDKSAPVYDCKNIDTINVVLKPDETPNIQFTAPVAVDNCDTEISGLLSNQPQTYKDGVNHLTWTFTDIAGNIATCPQYVNVRRLSVPSILCDTIGVDTVLLKSCECIFSKIVVEPFAMSSEGERLRGVADTDFKSFHLGENKFTWTFTDKHGLSSVCPGKLVGIDRSAPVLNCDTLQPVVKYVSKDSCSVSSVRFSIPIALDNCGDSVKCVLSTAIEEYPLDTTTVHWIFRDKANNSKTCPQLVIVKDTVAPVFDCSSLPVFRDTIISGLQAELNLTAPTAKDNCSQSITGKQVENKTIFPVGSTEIHWSFTDLSGNQKVCPQMVVITCLSAPSILCDTVRVDTVLLRANECTFSASPSIPIAVSTESEKLQGVADTDFKSFHLGENKFTWTFTDKHGLSSVCPGKLVGIDKSAPVVNCDTLQPVVKYVSKDSCSVSSVRFSTPIALDNCGDSVKGVLSTAIEEYPLDNTTVQWIFRDKANNSKTCPQLVIVKDTVAPVFDCSSLPVFRDTIISGLQAELNLTAPTAKDNCSQSITGKQVENKTIFPVGSTEIHWSFTDLSGNQKVCPQMVVITCLSAPSILCDTVRVDTVLLRANECTFSASPSIPIAVSTESEKLQGVADADFKSFHLGENKFTWTFTDKHGLSSVCPGKLVGIDKSAPVVNCDTVQPVVKYVSKDSCSVSSVSFSTPIALDNCGDSVKGVLSTAIEEYPLDNTTVQWIFRDKANNSKTCPQLVIVKDTITPSIDCDTLPQVSVDLTDGCYAENLKITAPVASDNCGQSVVGKLQTEMTEYPLGQTIITWTFKDAKGNQTVCPQTVLVKDKVKPVINCDTIKDIKVVVSVGEVAVVALPTPYALDSCRSWIPGVVDNLPSAYPDGKTTLQWSFKDAAGNSSYCSQTVEVVHVTPPSIDCDTLKSLIFYQSADCKFKDSVPVPVAVDFWMNKIPGMTEDLSSFGVGKHTLSWTFTDTAGAQAVCFQTLTVFDTIAPKYDCSLLKSLEVLIPNKEKGLLLDSLGLVTPQATDCSGSQTSLFSKSDSLMVGTNILQWHFVDAYGNTSVCSQSVIVRRKEKTELICPELEDVVLYLKKDECAVPFADAKLPFPIITADDGSTLAVSLSQKQDEFPLGETGITWKFIQEDASITYCPQTVIVKDTIRPSWPTSLRRITVNLSCADTVPSAPEFKALDNCSEVHIEVSEKNSQSDSLSQCGHYTYSVSRALVATDGAGNVSDTLYITYQVSDTLCPEFHLPKGWCDKVSPFKAIGICRFGVPNVMADMPDSALSDNCTPTDYIKVWQSPVEGTPLSASRYVNIYAEDLCGNIDSVTKFVYVPDVSDVVSVHALSDTVCANDTFISLISPKERDAHGYSWLKENGEWQKVNSTLLFDCYKGTIDKQHLVYSNNQKTYGDLFSKGSNDETLALRDSLTQLHLPSQSGQYYFVAMDTLTQCTDTASANYLILSLPILNVAKSADTLSLCHVETLTLDSITSYFNVEVDDSCQTRSAWHVYGDTSFSLPATDTFSVFYTAANTCGTVSSEFYPVHLLPVYSSSALSLSAPAKVYKDADVTLQLDCNFVPSSVEWFQIEEDEQANRLSLQWISAEDSSPYFYNLFNLQQNSCFYVEASDGQCSTVLSDTVCVKVITQIPTAITPYTLDGLNDCFMKGHHVMIFDQYKNKIFEGDDGWCGTMDNCHYKSNHALAGVYYYVLTMEDGSTRTGSVEIVRIDN